MQFIHTKPRLFHFFIIFFVAFVVRASVFFFYVQHEQRYRQADSNDYHVCALTISYTKSMTRPDTQQPIFWRTPGYPFFLAFFYHWFNSTSGKFEDNRTVHITALWFQIFLCSFIPIILFFLAWYMTFSYPVAWLTSLITIFHLGFVLASTFILTDGLASLFFSLFLLLFFMSFSVPRSTLSLISMSIAAAACLAIFTWMRPMGIFVSIVTCLNILIMWDTARKTLARLFSFILTFITAVIPWYIRNYALTGYWFFCPMSGGIIQAFCAPKILRRLAGKPLEKCMAYLNVLSQQAYEQDVAQVPAGKYVVRQFSALKIVQQLVSSYPWYFLYDWFVQVFKTLFDVYAHQLVAFATNSYTYDPSEEFLSQKIIECLWTAPLTWFARGIAWSEFLFSILMWVGIFGTCWQFIFVPLWRWITRQQSLTHETQLWLGCYILIGGIACMTGGWGYARLRLPIEPLMIIAALYWYQSWSVLRKNRHEKIIRTVA